MKKKKKGIFRGTPVIGARSSADLKTKNFGVTETVKKDGKKKKKRSQKQFTRFGRFGNKKKAKDVKKDLEKVGRSAKIMKRSVRTKGGGPKIETSFSVYQKGEK